MVRVYKKVQNVFKSRLEKQSTGVLHPVHCYSNFAIVSATVKGCLDFARKARACFRKEQDLLHPV